MSDKQKAAVYKWEEDYLFRRYPCKEILSLSETNELVYNISRAYGLYMPMIVTLPSTSTYASYDTEKNIVSLPPRGRNIIVLLHEMSHAILAQLDFAYDGLHDEHFMRQYIEVLNNRTDFERGYLTFTAKMRGLKIAASNTIKLNMAA